jgi:leader peptidase (prepilin peptidase)/N-methyltransferase
MCAVPLEPRDLVPVLSWLALRGRCRHCAGPIGIFYPIMELAALAVAVWSAIVFSGWLIWASCLLGWVLLTLAATDFKFYQLPDFLTLPLTAAGLLAAWLLDHSMILAHGLGAIFGFVFVVVLRSVYQNLRGREGMGLGDAKLLAAAGAWVSWNGLPSVILIASLAGLTFALIGARRGVNISLADRVPFGTFLCMGTWIVWLYGPLVAG